MATRIEAKSRAPKKFQAYATLSTAAQPWDYTDITWTYGRRQRLDKRGFPAYIGLDLGVQVTVTA